VIDPMFNFVIARFINHGCDPNCISEVVIVDEQPRAGIYASRQIEIGEQISYS
jgi:histone-lysine N-methyltransferase SETD2